MLNRFIYLWLMIAVGLWPSLVLAQCPPDQPVLTGATLANGLSIGVNTSNNRTDWLTSDGTMLTMQYPAGQAWGAVFITPGPAVPPGNRPGRDMSGCQALVLEMSGDLGTVDIGIKDSTEPDDGTEAKVTVQITGQWQTYTIPLSKFTRVDLKRVYVLTEFVFGGPQSQTVRVRNIKYASSASASITKVLPQFVSGAGWYSAVYLANTGDTAVSVQANFYTDDGAPLTLAAIGTSSKSVNLGARSTAIIEAPNTGALVQGYVLVVLPSGVVGYGVFRWSNPGNPDQEAVVPLSDNTSTGSTLIWDDTKYVTGIAVLNPTTVFGTVNLTVRNESGQVIGSPSISLAAGAKKTFLLTDLPGLGAVKGARGSAEFVAISGGVAVLGLRANGVAITSIPTSSK
jgi:hypothetical protein